MNFDEKSTQEIKNILFEFNLSTEFREFIRSSFRVRFKNQVLQLRAKIPIFLENCELEQNQILREFQEELQLIGINSKLEYRTCCQTGCFGCTTFSNFLS